MNRGRRDAPGGLSMKRLAGPLTLTSPLAPSGAVHLFRGDDYFAADGRALTWTDPGTAWPDLTGAAVRFRVHPAAQDTLALDVAATVQSADVVRVELTAAQTGGLAAAVYRYALVATLAGGHVVTLARAQLTAE